LDFTQNLKVHMFDDDFEDEVFSGSKSKKVKV